MRIPTGTTDKPQSRSSKRLTAFARACTPFEIRDVIDREAIGTHFADRVLDRTSGKLGLVRPLVGELWPKVLASR